MMTSTGEIIVASRMTDTYGLIWLLRREAARYEKKPSFGVRSEGGRLCDGMWWQCEKHARMAFAAVN